MTARSAPRRRSPQLQQSPLARYTAVESLLERHDEVLATIEWNERCAPPGSCPWCLETITRGHRPDCFLAELLVSPVLSGQRIAEYVPRRIGAGRYGDALLTFRQHFHHTQQQVADYLGMAVNYYARIERRKSPLAGHHAVKLAKLYKLSSIEYIYDLNYGLDSDTPDEILT